MLRLAVAAHGHAHPGCNCNELPVGQICGVPIKCSIFLLLYALWSTAGIAKLHAPWWVTVGIIVGGMVLLIVTILVHEFGHGLTVQRFGGIVHHILLWPLGGLCVHTMPMHGSTRQKLRNDWWVTLNGPLTHVLMVPIWVAVSSLLFLAFHLKYSSADLWHDLNPLDHASSLTRHPEAVKRGWGCILLLQLCSTAVSYNVLLFLFNLLFPMYPMDSSKLLVTGMQLCGAPVEKAAQRFIWISGACVLALAGLGAYEAYRWISQSQGHDYHQSLHMMGLGIIPIPFHIMLTAGLAFWGGRQTYDLYGLAEAKRLHEHPLFSHVKRTSKRVLDVANGRPDLWVDKWTDVYDEDEPPPPPPPPPRDYGAVRIVGGRVMRD